MKSDRLSGLLELVCCMAIIRRFAPSSFLWANVDGLFPGTNVLHTAAFNQAHFTQRYRRQLRKKKRYGVDKSPLGAFKATRQSTQVPQSPGSTKSVRRRYRNDGLECDDFLISGHEKRIIYATIEYVNN